MKNVELGSLRESGSPLRSNLWLSDAQVRCFVIRVTTTNLTFSKSYHSLFLQPRWWFSFSWTGYSRGPFLLISSIFISILASQKTNRVEVRPFTRATSNVTIGESYLLFLQPWWWFPFPWTGLMGDPFLFYFTSILSPKKVDHVESKDNSNGLSGLCFLYLWQGKQG